MDVYVRDVNGNTLAHVVDVLLREPVAVAAYVTDAGNVMVTVTVDERDETEIEAERMTADDMRAAPEWEL